jgi:hypothetical protein
LIPYNIYERCISLGKEQTLDAKNQGILDESLNSMSPLNRRVLDRILALMQRVTVKQSVNKMGPVQLGVVFAPGLLRPPADAPPMQIMNDAKYSAHFVVHLIHHYNRGHPVPPPPGGRPAAPPPAAIDAQRKGSRVVKIIYNSACCFISYSYYFLDEIGMCSKWV